VFQLSSGFCFVTFSEHTAPVTAVRFLPSGHALLSASLDGTVRAFDLVRWGRGGRRQARPGSSGRFLPGPARPLTVGLGRRKHRQLLPGPL
jgi:WD40 repeat protein